MKKIKKEFERKKTNVVKLSSRFKRDKNQTADIINIDEKINEKVNEIIKKRLGSFVKEMHSLKAKQKKLEEIQKKRSMVGFGGQNKRNTNNKGKDKNKFPNDPKKK